MFKNTADYLYLQFHSKLPLLSHVDDVCIYKHAEINVDNHKVVTNKN